MGNILKMNEMLSLLTVHSFIELCWWLHGRIKLFYMFFISSNFCTQTCILLWRFSFNSDVGNKLEIGNDKNVSVGCPGSMEWENLTGQSNEKGIFCCIDSINKSVKIKNTMLKICVLNTLKGRIINNYSWKLTLNDGQFEQLWHIFYWDIIPMNNVINITNKKQKF